MADGAETGLEETAAAPEDDRRRQGPQDESLAREALETHAEQHHERRQHTGEYRIFLKGFVGVLPGYLGFRVRLVVGAVHKQFVAGIPDRLLQGGGGRLARVIIDLRGIRGQGNAHPAYAGAGFERILHARDAGGASHSLDREVSSLDTHGPKIFLNYSQR